MTDIIKETILREQTFSSGNVTAYRKGKTVTLYFTTPTLNTDGKTLSVILPTEFRPFVNVRVGSKVYNGTSYVDATFTILTDGTMIIGDLYSGAIPKVEVNFFQTRPIIYQVS